MAPRSSVPPVDSLRPSGGLTFLQPETPSDPPSPSDLPGEETTSTPSQSGLLDGSPSASEQPHDEPAGPSEDDPTSSPASSGSKASALSKRALRDAVRKGVLMAGTVANEILARDEAAQHVGLYLADEDDAQAIGDPLASIANRRGGLGAAGNPDVGDAIAALVGLALYGWKQFARSRAAREMRAAAAQTAGLATPEAAAGLDDDPAGA